jgi:hypothetical protein
MASPKRFRSASATTSRSRSVSGCALLAPPACSSRHRTRDRHLELVFSPLQAKPLGVRRLPCNRR